MNKGKAINELRKLLSEPEIRDMFTKLYYTIGTVFEDLDAAKKQAKDLQAQLDMYGGDVGITAAFQKAAERDAAVEMLRGKCYYCKNNTGKHNTGKCGVCIHETIPIGWFERTDNWDWIGLRKEGLTDDQRGRNPGEES